MIERRSNKIMMDIIKRNTGNIPSDYDLKVSDIMYLVSMESKSESIISAFKYGFIMGSRATIANEFKERK